MIPKKQAVTGLTAQSSDQTKPIHCIKCGKMVLVTRRLGQDVQCICGKCKRK